MTGVSPLIVFRKSYPNVYKPLIMDIDKPLILSLYYSIFCDPNLDNHEHPRSSLITYVRKRVKFFVSGVLVYM